MDLRAYYRKIREIEATIPNPFVVVVSLDTQDGGKAGVSAEVAKPIAAKLIAEGRVKLATDDEAIQFYESHEDARLAAEARQAAQRMQVTLVPAPVVSSRRTKTTE